MALTVVQRVSAFDTAGEISLFRRTGASSCISSSVDMNFFLQPSQLIFQEKGDVSSSAKSSLGHVFLALAVVRIIMAYDAFGDASVIISSLSHPSSSGLTNASLSFSNSSKRSTKESFSYLSSCNFSSRKAASIAKRLQSQNGNLAVFLQHEMEIYHTLPMVIPALPTVAVGELRFC